jgi:penicillin-binding protein 1C
MIAAASERGRVAHWRRRLWGAAVVGVLFMAGIGLLDRCFPLPLAQTDGAVVVVAADGSPLRAYPSRDDVWRYPVVPAQVSPHYVQTLLAYEDRWFYWHPGVNPLSMLRAGWQWVVHGHIVSGGSTITMQVARLLDPALAAGPSRSLKVKVRQVFRALQLELHYSKDEILAAYLSRAPMGGIVEGVEMAAQLWLGKSARNLSLAETALLTALPQAPSRLRPDRHPRAAQAARDKVLDRLAALGFRTAADVADAKMENVVAPPLRAHWLAPLAAQRLWEQNGARPAATVRRQDPPRSAVIHSTLDADLQALIERMLRDRVSGLPPKVSVAVLVMDNDTLEVKAYAGSADFTDETRYAHVDMVRGVRSPGSTLKPFLYALALDEGLIHSQSLLLDEPMSFEGYAPGNFQASFAGPVSVSEALQRSLNVPAVDLLNRIGPARFASVMLAGGVRLRLPAGAEPNLSLILGGSGATLEELVGAYRALARDGLAGRPRLQTQQPRNESRIMSAGAAWIVRDILEGGGRPNALLQDFVIPGRRLAWKTGTSFGFRDAWAVGVTDAWTIGVWVGRPDGTPNPGYFGANVAAPLLRDMVVALPGTAVQQRRRPLTVQAVTTCWPSGVRQDRVPVGLCVEPRAAWALNNTVPPSFVGYADSLHGLLQLGGVANGTVLRPVPGQTGVVLDVNVQQAEGEVWWMLNGRLLGHTAARHFLKVALTSEGRYTLTAMDSQGHYDRVVFEIAGVTP